MWPWRRAINNPKIKFLPRITLMNTDWHRSDWNGIMDDFRNRERTQAIRQSRLSTFFSIALITLLSLAGCSKSQPASEPAAAPKAATITIDPATAGTISGIVSLKGLPPKMKPLDMTADPGCPTGPQPAEVVVVNAGKLANVFVYVKEGLPQGNFAVPSEPVVLDQKGCRYNPHMLGIMASQPLKITNTDTADHK